jgi:hypothetical protein
MRAGLGGLTCHHRLSRSPPVMWRPVPPFHEFHLFAREPVSAINQLVKPPLNVVDLGSLRLIDSIRSPLWCFRITQHQQGLLQVLASKLRGKAHVAYAAASFHTYSALFTHTRDRTIVAHSTFPSVDVLSGHDAWYYHEPGARGAANPRAESIEEPDLLTRLRDFPIARVIEEGNHLQWLDDLATGVVEAAREGVETVDGVNAQFFDDLQTVERLADAAELPPSLRAYAAVRLFRLRYGLSWFVVRG